MAILVALDPVDRALLRSLITALTEATNASLTKGAQTVASLDNLTAAIAKLDTDVSQAAADVATALDALRQQIADLTAGTITQEQIDALQAGVDQADAAITALDASVQPPAPVEPTEPV